MDDTTPRPIAFVFHAIGKRPIRVANKEGHAEAKARLLKKHPDFRVIDTDPEYLPVK